MLQYITLLNECGYCLGHHLLKKVLEEVLDKKQA